jgi:hypothetical protein
VSRSATCLADPAVLEGMCECDEFGELAGQAGQTGDEITGQGGHGVLAAGLTRRHLLGVGPLAVLGLAVGTPLAAANPIPTASAGPLDTARYGLTVRPRSEWAGKLGAKGTIPRESDVRFLLLHHSASSNDYTQAAVPGIIRGFYGFHTGPDKKWPDVAYNFFVDKFGTAWEARTGSLDGWVAGSATGGNQGYSQLVCLIGDYTKVEPTPAQVKSVVALFAALADRHKIDTAPEATTTFVSRGSNKQRKGATVTTPTINGHRTMSSTSCPGDAAFARLAQLRVSVDRLRNL